MISVVEQKGELMSDSISRQAVIEINRSYHGQMPNEVNHSIWKEINELPSVQPETAKRIVGKSRNGMTLWYQCDMCNEPVDAQDNFCRGCGRRLIDG